MKKILIIFFCALLLTACGAEQEQPDSTEATQPPVTEAPLTHVTIGGVEYPVETASLTLRSADPAELTRQLPLFSNLQSVHFDRPTMAADALLSLVESHPQIAFTWEMDVFGTEYAQDVTEIDLSGILMEGVEEVEALMGYFPQLQRLVMCDCGIDNETMAAFRDRVREQYKVIWSIQIRELTIRTDETTFMPVKYNVFVWDNHIEPLRYCEDMIVVDVGHMPITKLDFLEGMPNLQYLIVADTLIHDIEAVGGLKNLVYLEIFKAQVTDYSPLLGCTALEDLNASFTYGDHSVFAQMPWLKNLWITQCGVSNENRQLLLESLPDTHIEMDEGWRPGASWRDLPHYFTMRDMLEMPYNSWW